MSSHFGQIGPLTLELAALERLNIFILAGIEDMHKILDELEFQPLTTELAAIEHLKNFP